MVLAPLFALPLLRVSERVLLSDILLVHIPSLCPPVPGLLPTISSSSKLLRPFSEVVDKVRTWGRGSPHCMAPGCLNPATAVVSLEQRMVVRRCCPARSISVGLEIGQRRVIQPLHLSDVLHRVSKRASDLMRVQRFSGQMECTGLVSDGADCVFFDPAALLSFCTKLSVLLCRSAHDVRIHCTVSIEADAASRPEGGFDRFSSPLQCVKHPFLRNLIDLECFVLSGMLAKR